MLHHGPLSQPRNIAIGRLAIILSKEFNEGWRRTGNTTRLGGIAAGNTMRLLVLDVNF